jgi:cysteine dioxygenase
MSAMKTTATLPPPAERFPALATLIEYLDSLESRADLERLASILAGTIVTREQIEPVCSFGTQGYRRNIISASPWYELLALCWRSGHCTPIHDHRGSSCAFKVIEGVGTEIRFTCTPSGLVCPIATNSMPTGYVCAAEDEDIHQVANMQAPGQDLITLHIYSPPIQKMHTWKFAQSDGAENASRYE